MKALVVYGTRWGGTVGVAERIAEGLRTAGWRVDSVDARDHLPSVAAYDLVVVGSGIRADEWTKETLAFLAKNFKALRERKTALFVSCSMAEREESEAKEKAKEAYLLRVADRFGLQPVSCGFFGGYMDMKQSHGFLADMVVRVNGRNLRRHGLDTTGVTDKRDWAAIEAWTKDLVKAASDAG